MPHIILVFAFRKPGMSLADFKTHYETQHVPLLQSIAGADFPKAHTRRYIARDATSDATPDGTGPNANYPAKVLVGQQTDFDYDAFGELVFEDEAHFGKFYAKVAAEEAAKKIAADEEKFLDRPRMTIVVVDECNSSGPSA